MVKQGDIIFIDCAPTTGNEQSGKRPALVISNSKYNIHNNSVIVCPITSTDKGLPNLRIKLDDNTKTQGFILCEQVRYFDLDVRAYSIVESVSNDIFVKVYNAVNTLILPM